MQPTPAAAAVLHTPRLRLRPLGTGDEAALQRVFDSSEDHFRAVSGAPATPGAAAGEIAGCAASPGRAVALLELADGGEAVGAIGWWEGNPSSDRALLGTLTVVPEHRGRGLAAEALAALEEALAARGLVALRTAVEWRRRAVHPVVKALGFSLLPIAEHTKLGLSGAGLALYEKPLG